MQYFIENGICGQMALWNPVDLGYSSTFILESHDQAGEVSKERPGDKVDAGRNG